MKTINQIVSYDKTAHTISCDGKIVVDLSKVPKQPKGKIFSASNTDFLGVDIEFYMEQSSNPFIIKIEDFPKSIHFSAAEFLMAIVENRIEIEGMEVNEEISQFYSILWDITRV